MAQTINTRQLMLESATFRSTVTESTIAVPTISEFIKLETTGTLSPSSIVLNAVVFNTTNPSYSWAYRSNDPAVTDWTTISGQTSSSLTVTGTNFSTYLGTEGTQVSFRVTSKDSVNVDVQSSTATQVITYSDESKDAIVISNSAPNVTIVSSATGNPINLNNTGIKLQLSKNGNFLTYGTSGANTWNIGTPTQSPTNSVTLGTGSITDSNLSYTYGNIGGLTEDQVIVTFPITVRNSQNIARNIINTTQKFIKNKSGNTYELTITGGIRSFTYDQSGGSPTPSATSYTVTLTENGSAVTPTSYSWSTGGQLTGTGTTASFTPSLQTTFSSSANTFVQCQVVYAGNTITRTIPIAINRIGNTGATGSTGNKTITISAYRWSNSGIGTYSQGFTYDWTNGTASAYPTATPPWTSSAGAAPGTGYVLYQLNLVISDSNSATSTAANWSSATANTIGYRQDGSIGAQGDSYRIAYFKSTSATPPGSPGTTTGSSSVPSGWSASPMSLVDGEFMYQSDGVYVASTNTVTWSAGYLSNLKVGNLSAISASLGVVGIASGGSLASTGKTYGSATAGFFLGWDSSAYKFDIGNSTNYLRWDGSILNIAGTIALTSSSTIDGATASTVKSGAASGASSLQPGGAAADVNANVTTISGGKITTGSIEADRISVTNLSSINSNLGTITAGSITIGNPVISGTTITGSGATILSNGNFAAGNSATNITFNGTVLTLNGNIVASANIQTGAVTAAKILDGEITAGKFSSGIQPVGIVSGSTVPTTRTTDTIFLSGTGKLYRWNGTAYTAAVDTSDLNGTITQTQISDNAISTPKLAANAVNASKIEANTITANEIAANTITAGQIAAATITATQIAANTITATQIAAATITATQIAANTITAGQIQAGTITADRMNITNLSSINSNLGTITGGELSVGTGNTIFKVDSSGNIWSGNATFASAPFRVTNTGALTAANVTLSGDFDTTISGHGRVRIGPGASLLNTLIRVDPSTSNNWGIFVTGTSSVASVNGSNSTAGAIGIRGSGSIGVYGTGTTYGVHAHSSGGTALYVEGSMQITNTSLVTNLNADKVDGKDASAFVEVAAGTTNAKYLYYLNNNTAPSNTTTMTAWIKLSTNDGAVVWVPGYA